MQYAVQHNLEFSNDPNPTKSKSKCIYVSVPARNVVLPEPLHLGHTLTKTALWISMLSAKEPPLLTSLQISGKVSTLLIQNKICMKAAQVYVSDAYGLMIYDLARQSSQSYLKSWNTFVKLTWEVQVGLFATEYKLMQTCLSSVVTSATSQLIINELGSF